MNQERWHRIEEVFHRVLPVGGDDRERLLDESCSGDPDLRREVSDLLAGAPNAGASIRKVLATEALGAGGMGAIYLAERDGSQLAKQVAVKILSHALGSSQTIARFRDELPSSSLLSAPGGRIGQYELIRELGRGGMGAVYAARDVKLGRKVAIKFLSSNHPELADRFIIEARATAQCSHENIIVIHDVGEHGGNPFMVLEYLQGAPLTQLLQAGRRLPPAQAIELMVPVVRALTVAHAHAIVHRDLKPDNIFVTDSGTIKVLDFGIAMLLHGGDDDAAAVARNVAAVRAAEPSTKGKWELTRRGSLIGTLPYMSPEQWGAAGTVVDHQTDLWAVGIILFEMVAGHHPLAPRQGWDLRITGMLQEPMPSVRSACPDIPDELADVIDRCLQKPKEQRFGTARELRDALEPLLPGRYVRQLRSDENPYAGLKSFQESDAHRFFGRSSKVAAAVARLRDVPLLGIVGPSGVGKSSFVRAGIMPALKASGEQWSTFVVRPGRSPMAALAYALTPMVTTTATTEITTGALEDLSQQQQILERLYAEPGFLGAALRSRARSRNQHILLFVDQFEELYTQVPDPRERLAFTACLASVCDDVTTPLRLVLSLRSDFLDGVAEAPALMAELTHGLFFLTPPNRDGLRDALIQPAEMAGYQFESPAMVESMLDHLEHTPGALPLLQFAASQLWEMRDRERRLLTAASYERIGGIAGALASHADAILADCTTREQTLVRALFLRLITPERTRAIVPVCELYELSPDHAELHRVVDRLVRSRLLVGQTTAAEAGGTIAGGSVELIHESLIQSWPLLRRWLDEIQEDAAFLEQLRNTAKQWQTKGFPQYLLWRGEAMQEAKHWHSRYRGELPELQRAFLNAVFSLSARAARRRRLAIGGAMTFLVLLVIAAAVALVMIRDAQQEATSQAERALDQLKLTQAAEIAAKDERSKAVAASKKLETQNASLVAAIETANRARTEAEFAQVEAEEARQRAEQSKRNERQSRRRALREAERANTAAAAAKLASEKLEARLAAERKRVQELQDLTGGAAVVAGIDVRSPARAQPASGAGSDERSRAPSAGDPSSTDDESALEDDSPPFDDSNAPWTQGVSGEDRRAARTLCLEGNRFYMIPLFARAAEQFEAALRKWKHPGIYYNLALTQRNLGKERDALENLERALQYGEKGLGPKKFLEAQKQLAELKRRLGRLQAPQHRGHP